jgi:hypothetical protein
MGHFDQFPATSPSVGYLFGQETVVGETPTTKCAESGPLGNKMRLWVLSKPAGDPA